MNVNRLKESNVAHTHINTVPLHDPVSRLYYYNDKWQVMCEYTTAGTVAGYYIYGNYIDEVLCMYGLGLFKFVVHDHLYSPVALIGVGAAVLERYEYDAYGNCRVLEPNFADDPDGKSDFANPYFFTGRQVDTLDSGSLKIQYNRNRYLDYYMGRWFTQDPLGYVDGLNLYEYVKSNPMRWRDMWGLYHDFNPSGPNPPSIPGGAIVWNISSWPSATMHILLYNFYTRLKWWIWSNGKSAEYVRIGGAFLNDVIGQSLLVDYADAVERQLEIDAKYMLSELDCGANDSFSDRGSSIILADLMSTNVRLSLQTFTVWWNAKCIIGPRKCCAPMDDCSGGCGSKAFWHCSVSWSLYDYYDFAWFNPIGMLGHPFHITGSWKLHTGGTAKRCSKL